MSAWFDELAEFLRIPSISADPAHAGHVAEAGEWVCNFIREAGGEAELVDWKGQPLAIGELRASAADGAPTVLCYGHFDVQPPDPLELWESEPFEPVLRDGYLYGRGTVDDKGQLYMLLAAARELARAGELPVNVRCACDGEEETAGHSLVEFLAGDERGAEAGVIFDSGMIAPGVPAFDVATRGNIYYHLELRTGERDLHSGLYGGAALNAMHALVLTLSVLLAPGQRVEEIAPELERLLREATPEGAELAIDRWAASPPGLVPPDATAIQLGLDAFERAVGRRPLLVRSGGTLPIVPAFAEKGIPVIVTGFGLPDSQIHSPNGKLRAEYVPLGIAAARELFRELAAL